MRDCHGLFALGNRFQVEVDDEVSERSFSSYQCWCWSLPSNVKWIVWYALAPIGQMNAKVTVRVDGCVLGDVYKLHARLVHMFHDTHRWPHLIVFTRTETGTRFFQVKKSCSIPIIGSICHIDILLHCIKCQLSIVDDARIVRANFGYMELDYIMSERCMDGVVSIQLERHSCDRWPSTRLWALASTQRD